MAMRWSRWVATGRRRRPRLAVAAAHDQVVALDLDGRRRLASGPSATAASRSLSLTRSSCRPRIRVSPLAKAAATASTGYSSIIEGARAAGTSTPFSAEWRTRRSADLLAALDARGRGSRCGRPSPSASRSARCAAGSSSRLRPRCPSPARSARRPAGRRPRRDRPAPRPARAAAPAGRSSAMRAALALRRRPATSAPK